MIEQAEIDRVKRETDLVKLIESSGVKLKRKGKLFNVNYISH